MVEAVRKPGSVPATGCPAAGDGHSSRTAVAGGLQQPTRKHGRATLNASLFGLAPGGVYLAPGVTAGPGELLPHPFTLTRRGGRIPLCGTFPGVTPAGRYPAPRPLEPGLSSPCKQAAATWTASTNRSGFAKSPSAALHSSCVAAAYHPGTPHSSKSCAWQLELLAVPGKRRFSAISASDFATPCAAYLLVRLRVAARLP